MCGKRFFPDDANIMGVQQTHEKNSALMIDWICKEFDDLQPQELYIILQLRMEVFVVEQKCAFQDADNKDQFCHHLMGLSGGELLAYSRIVPAGISYREISIGRIVTSPKARKSGFGKLLMQKSMQTAFELFGKGPIRIGAQLYLQKFYETFEFKQSSEIYLEDGIAHIEMRREYTDGNDSINWNESK
jgi:ElaA protein